MIQRSPNTLVVLFFSPYSFILFQLLLLINIHWFPLASPISLSNRVLIFCNFFFLTKSKFLWWWLKYFRNFKILIASEKQFQLENFSSKIISYSLLLIVDNIKSENILFAIASIILHSQSLFSNLLKSN